MVKCHWDDDNDDVVDEVETRIARNAEGKKVPGERTVRRSDVSCGGRALDLGFMTG